MAVIKIYNEDSSAWEPVVVGRQGPQGPSGPTGSVGDLSDVTVSGPQEGDILRYDGTDWVSGKLNAEDLAEVGAASSGDVIGALTQVGSGEAPPLVFRRLPIGDLMGEVGLGDLGNVSLVSPSAGDTLSYNGVLWQVNNIPPLLKADMVGDQELGMFSSRVSGFTGSRPDDDNIHFSYFTSYISGQPSTVYISVSGGNASGMSAAKVGIYSVATNGDLTLVWTSASIISQLEASGNFRVVTIDTSTGTWTGSLVKGGRYAFAFYQLGTTRASLARLNADGALNAVPPIMSSRFGVPPSSPNLPSTLQGTDLASDFRYYWAALKL
jgi:hypothetical protein